MRKNLTNGFTILIAALVMFVMTWLVAPTAQAIDLFVSSERTDEVLRYNGTTGAFIDVFASGGALRGPTGLVFGPDGNLYVSSRVTHDIKRYDGPTGAFIDAFASGGGLSLPQGLVFGPDGNLYVSSDDNSPILDELSAARLRLEDNSRLQWGDQLRTGHLGLDRCTSGVPAL